MPSGSAAEMVESPARGGTEVRRRPLRSPLRQRHIRKRTEPRGCSAPSPTRASATPPGPLYGALLEDSLPRWPSSGPCGEDRPGHQPPSGHVGLAGHLSSGGGSRDHERPSRDAERRRLGFLPWLARSAPGSRVKTPLGSRSTRRRGPRPARASRDALDADAPRAAGSPGHGADAPTAFASFGQPLSRWYAFTSCGAGAPPSQRWNQSRCAL